MSVLLKRGKTFRVIVLGLLLFLIAGAIPVFSQQFLINGYWGYTLGKEGRSTYGVNALLIGGSGMTFSVGYDRYFNTVMYGGGYVVYAGGPYFGVIINGSVYSTPYYIGNDSKYAREFVLFPTVVAGYDLGLVNAGVQLSYLHGFEQGPRGIRLVIGAGFNFGAGPPRQ